MNILTFTEARSQFKTVLDDTVNNADVTIIHRRDGEDVVLIGRNQYESMMETIYLLSTPANANALLNAFVQDKLGQATEQLLLNAE